MSYLKIPPTYYLINMYTSWGEKGGTEEKQQRENWEAKFLRGPIVQMTVYRV